ncbi:thymidine phosphorylase [Alicyclobacillus tolerans]|uniref:thymidine phosphorylase n=1 Tax=Alicyclobacillus tolerans TaxID=90970 RepID=UPI003B75E557
MRVVEWIERKRRGGHLSGEEITQLIRGYVAGDIPDYQMSALLMAIVFQGMDEQEITSLTLAMADSGDRLTYPKNLGFLVDKHSTGGVGDKTSIALMPWLAAMGVPIAKMSGRGLGHTGGTIDKLESIPGFRTELNQAEFVQQVEAIGIALAGQSGNLAPADKMLYALRDVTGTVASLPLIASSIMSKKLASGADGIVLDVKVGEGAFMQNEADAQVLARQMVQIGTQSGKKVVALLSRMDEPLGYAVGNALEVKEAIDTLRGCGPDDFTELCYALGIEMMLLAGLTKSPSEARHKMKEAIENGQALEKMRQWIDAQGGIGDVVIEPEKILPRAPFVLTIHAPQSGTIEKIHALAAGEIAMRLGAGRATKTDKIDVRTGLVFLHKVGAELQADQPLVEIHARSEQEALAVQNDVLHLFEWGNHTSKIPPSIVIGRVVAEVEDVDTQLLATAQQAMKQAYVPYSRFPVGAALRLASGRIISGCNVENASYGLTNCAERSAIFRFVSEIGVEHDRIVAIAVAGDTEEAIAPCGACRQVMVEFCSPDTPVYLSNLQGKRVQTSVGELLPGSFGSSQLRSHSRDC